MLNKAIRPGILFQLRLYHTIVSVDTHMYLSNMHVRAHIYIKQIQGMHVTFSSHRIHNSLLEHMVKSLEQASKDIS